MEDSRTFTGQVIVATSSFNWPRELEASVSMDIAITPSPTSMTKAKEQKLSVGRVMLRVAAAIPPLDVPELPDPPALAVPRLRRNCRAFCAPRHPAIIDYDGMHPNRGR